MAERKDALGRRIDDKGRLIYDRENARVMYAEAISTRKRKEETMTLIQQIKQFDIDRMDPDDAIALSAQARALEAEYAGFGAEMDERLKDKIEELRTFIRASQKQFIQKRLREIRQRKQTLMPKEQKLAALDAEEKALEAKLSQ